MKKDNTSSTLKNTKLKFISPSKGYAFKGTWEEWKKYIENTGFNSNNK